MDLFVRAWLVLKYVLAGCLVWFVGTLFFGTGTNFHKRSEPVMLVVVDVQWKRADYGAYNYRPTFAVESHAPPRADYTGRAWYRSSPHEKGDIVPGRYDLDRGEMRSDKMLAKTIWLGRIAKILGALIALQAVLLALGLPEDRLPLRLLFGAPRGLEV